MRHAGRSPDGSVDWTEVRERLARAQAVASDTQISAERARVIMDERARALAAKRADVQTLGDIIEVLTFALATERYAIETKYIREVVRLVDFTPVPGAPDFVVGATNHRGQVLCLVDLRPFLKAAVKGVTDLSRIIVLGIDTIEFGVLADRAEGIERLPAGELLPRPDTSTGIAQEYLRGLTRNALMVLDGRLLLHDSRLFVDQRDTGAA